MPCAYYGDGLTVCFTGPTVVLHAEFEERPRWCFNCRRHVRYNLELHGTREPSYYEPSWSGRCPNCGQDGASGGFWYVSWNDDGEFA
jgi:hypothetical protein